MTDRDEMPTVTVVVPIYDNGEVVGLGTVQEPPVFPELYRDR